PSAVQRARLTMCRRLFRGRPNSPFPALLIAVAGLFFFGAVPVRLTAQEKPAAGAGVDREAAPAPSDWERLVYLPYKNLKQVFEKEGAAVFMPYGQFQKMWDKMRVVDLRDPAKPPVKAVITDAAYTGTIAGDIARIEAALTIEVLGKPWVE